ncbi:hypothetical protein F8388_019701 [Cannabis sativa]|uniref:Autophagy-related protein 101 n=1 Tax=Cannabis sativa TaxID=3483 RepID=A0A7J6FGK5_CANSA|nr:hypothetical protein F8388_019701 [Cannabis sativa]
MFFADLLLEMNPPRHPAATTSPKARRSDSKFLFLYIGHENRWECLKEILLVWERQNIVVDTWLNNFYRKLKNPVPMSPCDILYTILFHRAIGLVRPKDADLELFDITYVQCGDLEIEKKIEEKIEQFISWVEKHPIKKSQVCGI